MSNEPKKYDLEEDVEEMDNLAQTIYWHVEHGAMKSARKIFHDIYMEGVKDGKLSVLIKKNL